MSPKEEYQAWCSIIRQLMPQTTYDEHRYWIDAFIAEQSDIPVSTQMCEAMKQFGIYLFQQRWLPF